MLTLGEFEEVSGMKVNKEKTKVVKLGGWGDNGTILCEDLKLDWTQEFISLGITYNINQFHKITELNLDTKIKEIQKLIKIWNARFLTPFGKIVIIKSLLISKITHVPLSLPSPNQESFKYMEEMFKRFFWNNKAPKFRKEISETLLNLGGLKLTNLQKFDSALKISWLKRIAVQSEGWAIYPLQHGFSNLLTYGDKYHEKVIANTQNKFWGDTAKSINDLYNTLNYTNSSQILNSPLWYNGILNFEYRKEWERKGYVLISDILNDEGMLLTLNEMRERGLRIIFLDYHRLDKRLKDLTQGVIIGKKSLGPHIPRLLFEIGINNKGCNRTYNKLMTYNANIIVEVKTNGKGCSTKRFHIRWLKKV